MKYTFFCCLLFLYFAEDPVYSQPPSLPAPRLYMVTVDPETGFDIITWYNPNSPLIDYFVVATRVDPMPGQPDSYIPVYTGITDTSYINSNTESGVHPVGYTVWGMHNNTRGSFNDPDSTMYSAMVFDSCAGTITLTWNDYNSWRGSTAQFTIFRRNGPGNYQLISTVNPNPSTTRYTYVLNNIQINEWYSLFVQAANIDGIRRSDSNRDSVFTKMSRQAGSINADYATISAGNTIDLSFTVRGSTGQDKYRLFRGTDFGGPYVQIDSLITTDSIIHYADDTPFASGVYYYRLDMVNHCNTAFTQSNLANNIILGGTISGSVVSLAWNEYRDWAGGVERYRIVRTSGRTNPLVDTLDGGTGLNYTDDVAALIDYSNPSSSLICYHVDALEGTNLLGVRARSLSNQVCFTVVPDIHMPNAFIPNDAEQVNRVFEPVFSFTPEHYEMIIFNRLGTKIWEGTGPWDGKVAGKPVPEGVYLYLLRIFNYSSDIQQMNGKVVVVYR